MRRQPDDAQLEFAVRAGRVLFTHNAADFRRLDAAWHRAGRTHAGIVVLTDQRTPIGVQVRCFEALASLRSAEEMKGRLEFLLNYA